MNDLIGDVLFVSRNMGWGDGPWSRRQLERMLVILLRYQAVKKGTPNERDVPAPGGPAR